MRLIMEEVGSQFIEILVGLLKSRVDKALACIVPPIDMSTECTYIAIAVETLPG